MLIHAERLMSGRGNEFAIQEDDLVYRDCTHRHQKHGEEAGWDTGSGYYDITNDRDEHEDNYTDAAIVSAPRGVGYYEGTIF
jgi:hypothetical protein